MNPKVFRKAAQIMAEMPVARRMKVSNAWVIRDAVEKYVAEEEPLLRTRATA